MKSEEIWQQYELGYNDLLLYLKKKYDLPKGSYYLTEACASTNAKIRRGSEGL